MANQTSTPRSNRRRTDDSPEAIEARMRGFVDRTRGWGSKEVRTKLPDDLIVLAGPTRPNPPLKTVR